jgi:murein DD-endopeptidase MepM/ murein hydrolase activator NlpD
MSVKKSSLLLILFLFASFTALGFSEVSTDTYPEYVIEDGDFLSIVATRFSTTVDDILQINNIPDANSVLVGDKIKIPSLKGMSGILSTESITIGDSIKNVSIRNGMSEESIIDVNRITSPSELYIGSMLMIVQNTNGNTYSGVDFFDGHQTLIEKAILQKGNPLSYEKINRINGSWDIAEKQLLFANVNKDSNPIVRSISPLIDILEIKQLPLIQGETHVIHIKTPYVLSLSGKIGEQSLQFFQDSSETSDWYALFGIDAMQDTGLTTFAIHGSDQDGNLFDINQKIVIEAGQFTYEVVDGVDEATLEDYSNQVDNQTLAAIVQTSPVKLWGTQLSYPVDEPCLASGFGNRRTYNDGSYNNYHTGVDFSVCSANNLNIYAAADGQVLFTGELPIHGNHTVIDHGWGVYSTYSHQSEIFVTAGQNVKRGDLIGKIGSTGRSVGPHLHWEVKINGTYVNPITWLNTIFP